MKNALILIAALCGFVLLIFLVQQIYRSFSNTWQIIDFTEEAVRTCGEGKVAAVTLDGYTCTDGSKGTLR